MLGGEAGGGMLCMVGGYLWGGRLGVWGEAGRVSG